MQTGIGFTADYSGLTLRDYFAAEEKSSPPISFALDAVGDWPTVLAKWRYACSDAMVKERERC